MLVGIDRFVDSLKRKVGDTMQSAGWFGKVQKTDARVEALLKARRLLQNGPDMEDVADTGVWAAPRSPSPEMRREASIAYPQAFKFMQEEGFETFDAVKNERTLVLACCEWSRTRIS